MAQKQGKPTRSRSQGANVDIRAFRSDVAKLKKLGLVSKRVDARSQRVTRYMRDQITRFDVVLKDQAKVLKVDRSISSQFNTLDHKFNRIVVPSKKGETVKIVKPKQSSKFIGPSQPPQIIKERVEYARLVREHVEPRDPFDTSHFPTGPDILYYARVNGHQTKGYWKNLNELKEFLNRYDATSHIDGIYWIEYSFLKERYVA